MWLFDRRTDLWAFGGSAAVAVGLWLLIQVTGLNDEATPAWGFLIFVVGVDVAHVWATAWRVYLDGEELQRRSRLYLLGPVLTLAAGMVLHAMGPGTFWRAMAYLAVFHFVRQQYGFVNWYRRKGQETDRASEIVDTLAIYSATLGPLVWWHSHLPRPFHWFVQGDFVPLLPEWTGTAALWTQTALLLVYVLFHLSRGAAQVWGKHLVVFTTALCWWLSIVQSGGDLAFTVVNVIPHGVPYVVLCARYARGRAALTAPAPSWMDLLLRVRWPAYLALLVAVAFLEEAAWDVTIWHDHPTLFSSFSLDFPDAARTILVPLLALPQAWHYVLDGFIWRGGPKNPLLGPALQAAQRGSQAISAQ